MRRRRSTRSRCVRSGSCHGSTRPAVEGRWKASGVSEGGARARAARTAACDGGAREFRKPPTLNAARAARGRAVRGPGSDARRRSLDINRDVPSGSLCTTPGEAPWARSPSTSRPYPPRLIARAKARNPFSTLPRGAGCGLCRCARRTKRAVRPVKPRPRGFRSTRRSRLAPGAADHPRANPKCRGPIPLRANVEKRAAF